MTRTVNIVLPLPDKTLRAAVHGSGRTAGSQKAKQAAIKKARKRGEGYAMAALEAAGMLTDPPRFELAEPIYRFFWQDRSRAMDYCNALQACKPFIDGCTDAGVIRDDDWKTLLPPAIRYGFCKTNPRLELEIREIREGEASIRELELWQIQGGEASDPAVRLALSAEGDLRQYRIPADMLDDLRRALIGIPDAGCLCSEIRHGLSADISRRAAAEEERESSGHYPGCPLHPMEISG